MGLRLVESVTTREQASASNLYTLRKSRSKKGERKSLPTTLAEISVISFPLCQCML